VDQHPLGGAFLRIDRAGEHLADIQDRIDAFKVKEQEVTAMKVEGMTVSVVGEQNPPPPELGVVIGEFIYNLRTALEYLVFELAFLDSGEVQHRTQFLIEDTPEGFRGRGKTAFKGLTEEHIAAFERLQPYNGCGWTRLLRDMSNRDKHRTLHVASSIGETVVRVGSTVDEAIAAGGTVREGEVGVYFKPAFDVVFPDGTPVMKPLPVLQSEVRALLEEFKPAFKR
jgi:hypothetical protein